jgi:hydroxyethylthiazole kinase
MSSENRKVYAEVANLVRERRPLVHCITNYVTVNDCANAVLAVGGSPVMADDAREIADIVAIASSLVINIGTLNARTVKSMRLAGKAAAKIGKPVILDPVGAGASALRTKTAIALVREIPFAVIRGNSSEIATLLAGSGNTRGVDAADDGSPSKSGEKNALIARELSRKTGAVVVVTGAIDTIADGSRIFKISNGHPMMARITGSGCMLTAVLGAYCGACHTDRAIAAAAAVSIMGIAGERAARAAESVGLGTFRTRLIDELSRIDGDGAKEDMRIETA